MNDDIKIDTSPEAKAFAEAVYQLMRRQDAAFLRDLVFRPLLLSQPARDDSALLRAISKGRR
jgi:hypothetical protein